VTFTVPEGWLAGYDEPTHIDLFAGNNNRQLSFISGAGSTPRRAIERFRRAKGLRAGAVVRGRFGSYEGMRLDVAHAGGSQDVIFGALDFYTVRRGHRVRVWAVRAEGETVLAVLQGTSDFEDLVTDARAVLESARFGGA
jgi:hypothetical protein